MFEKLKLHDGGTPGKVLEVKLEYPKPKVATMIKNIWHKLPEQPENGRDVIEKWYHLGTHYTHFVAKNGIAEDNPFTDAWCYLDDLLALENELDRAMTQLALYKDFADSAKRTLDGSNVMIKSWHKLLQSDYAAETKCHILNQAISAYVEEREKHALRELNNEQ